MILLLVEHEGSDGPTLIGTNPSLTTDTNSGVANAKMVGGAGNGAEGGKHLIEVVMES